MKKLFLSLIILMFPISAQADDGSAVCRILGQQKNTNVAYQPGVDVRGKAVVPADLNGGAPSVVPQVVKVPVDVDLVKRMASLNGKDIKLDAPIGMMEIHQDGKVSYNGQDWTAPVMTLCGFSHAVIQDTEMDTLASPADIAPAAPATPAQLQVQTQSQSAPNMPKVIAPAVQVEEAPVKIYSNRPDLIGGSAYRESGE